MQPQKVEAMQRARQRGTGTGTAITMVVDSPLPLLNAHSMPQNMREEIILTWSIT